MKFIEVFENSDAIYIVTEYYEGGDLQMYMEQREFEALDEDRVKELAANIA